MISETEYKNALKIIREYQKQEAKKYPFLASVERSDYDGYAFFEARTQTSKTKFTYTYWFEFDNGLKLTGYSDENTYRLRRITNIISRKGDINVNYDMRFEVMYFIHELAIVKKQKDFLPILQTILKNFAQIRGWGKINIGEVVKIEKGFEVKLPLSYAGDNLLIELN